MLVRKHYLKLILMALLVAALVFTFGCGGAPEDVAVDHSTGEATSGDTSTEGSSSEGSSTESSSSEGEEESAGSGEIDFADNWENPQALTDFMQLFGYIKYHWTTYGSSMEMEYRVEGEEKVGSVDTTKLSVTLTIDDVPQQIVMWVDDEGSAVQAEMYEVTFTGAEASGVTEGLLEIVFWPFDQADEYELDQLLAGSEIGLAVGYDVAVEENLETRAFGDLQAAVHKVIMTMTGSAQGVTVTNLEWHIGDFGSFQMTTC